MAYLGIDLGTTNSVAVIFNESTNELDTVKIEGMDEVLPSVVCFSEDGIIVGEEAKNSAIIYPQETVLSIKRRMGENEPIEIGGKSYLPQDISAIILKTLKEAAESQASQVFDEVVITHPAYFNDRQIFATKQAGELAGFKTVHLLSEPLAAAIEYGYKQGYAQTLLVYDLGGGTFDACVLKVQKDLSGNEHFMELSDVGDMNLGGDDFDALLIDYMIQKFELISGIKLKSLDEYTYLSAMQKLKYEAEQLKKKLSVTHKASVKISPFIIIDGVPHNLVLEVTKEDFEGLIRPLIERSREIVGQALERAGLEPDDISKVILVGGSTLVPMVKRMVAGYIKEPYRATDPAKSVAMGAAIFNYLIHLPNSNVKVGQITRQHIGTEAVVNTTTMERRLIPIIPMGTTIPASITDDGFKASEGSAVRVDVYQWEDGYEDARKYIGSLLLEGISKEAELSITYSINEDNIFEAQVKDLNTDKTVSGTFDRSVSLPKLPEITSSSSGDEPLSIVFIIDTTGSMDPYIEGVQKRAIEFSNILKSKGIDFQLGLIGFGDLLEKEKPSVYKFTTDIEKFQKRVRKIPRTSGGDIPESSLDAIETALMLIGKTKSDKYQRHIFILITDAPPHIPTQSGKTVSDLCEILNKHKITTYVVAKKDQESVDAYEPLTRTDGKYYDMNDDFYDILDHIAMSIAQLLRIG